MECNPALVRPPRRRPRTDGHLKVKFNFPSVGKIPRRCQVEPKRTLKPQIRYVLSFSLSLLDYLKVLAKTKKVQDLIIFVVVQE